MFQYDQVSHRLSLDPEYELKLTNGDFCPTFKKEILPFFLFSDEYPDGKIESEFELRVESGASALSAFDFSYDWRIARKIQESEGFRKPQISIGDVSSLGELEIVFSDPFIVPKALDGIKETEQLFVEIPPVADQTETQIKFDWSVQSYTANSVVISLLFEAPHYISVYNEFKNYVEIEINDSSLFVREQDRFSIPRKTFLTKDLPRMSDKSLAGTFKALGDIVAVAGKGQLIVVIALQMLGSYKLNQYLGKVRALGLVVHLLLIQLMFPPIMDDFYSGLLEFVNFDLIPTDKLYAWIFGWENVPFSHSG